MTKPISDSKRLIQLEERVYQLETCYKITSLLNSELNLGNLLDTIMNVAKKVMNADACSLLLVDDNNEELIFQIALSDVGEEIKTMTRLKIGEGIAGNVAKTGEPLIIKDAYQHPQFNSDYDKKTGFETGSILCSPLKVKGEVMGVCQVIHGKKKGVVFQESDLELFLLLCDSAALAIHNARLHLVLMENQRMEKDMEFAQSVQESFLPTSTPQHENFVFAAGTHAAQVVGGDYYDFIPRCFGNCLGRCFRQRGSRRFADGAVDERLPIHFPSQSRAKKSPDRDQQHSLRTFLPGHVYHGGFLLVGYE